MERRMEFRNATSLDTRRLYQLILEHTRPYRHDRLRVAVRWSRGAAFSGTCFYNDGKIFVNLGRTNRYPYAVATHVARSQSNRTHWWRETYSLKVRDGYELALFVYLHELYHYLVKQAGRSPRRKEAMCDRFATRVLVDRLGCRLADARGRPVPRLGWDFQDVEQFVVEAPRQRMYTLEEAAVVRAIPVRIVGARLTAARRPEDG